MKEQTQLLETMTDTILQHSNIMNKLVDKILELEREVKSLKEQREDFYRKNRKGKYVK